MLPFLQAILRLVWLLLPAGVGNTVPVIAARYYLLPALRQPIDGGATWRGRRLLGDHKTWRGLILGILFGSITGYLQYMLWPQLYRSAAGALVMGAAVAFGGLAGDALKSFLKRQLDIAPGKPWRPFDQIDWVIGAFITVSFFISLSLLQMIVTIIFFGILSWATSAIGFRLKIKKSI